MSFKFNFNIEEDEDQAESSRSFGISGPSYPPQTSTEASISPCHHCTLDELLDTLPGRLTYSPLELPFLPRPLLRRDLHDARFQLASGEGEAEGDDEGVEGEGKAKEEDEYASADTDLIPGLYEGGLKTWEGGVDLVEVLAGKDGLSRWIKGNSVLEIGCGTALPSAYLLSLLLADADDDTSTSSTTKIHIQDYNRPVLSLVSLPNLILAAIPFLPPTSLHPADEAEDLEETVLDYEQGGEIDLTPQLKSAFKSLLASKQIELAFTYGHWDGLANEFRDDDGRYGLILTAETIYSEGSVDSLIRVLREASAGQKEERKSHIAVELEEGLDRLDVNDSWESANLGETSVVLVAAKILYFGVGGGIQDFVSRVKATGGWTAGVEDWVKGVGRRVIRVGW